MKNKVSTSSRKAKYYSDDINSIKKINSTLISFYFVLVLAFSIAELLFFGNFRNVRVWFKIVSLVVFPFVIKYIHALVVGVFRFIFLQLGVLDKRIVSE